MSEKDNLNIVESSDLLVMPLLALRGIVVLPAMSAHFEVGRKKSVAAVNAALRGDKKICLVTQCDLRTDDPARKDLYDVGTVAVIRQVINLPGNTIRVLVEGVSRAMIGEVFTSKPYLTAEIAVVEEKKGDNSVDDEALLRTAVEAFEDYSEYIPKVSGEVFMNILSMKNCGALADYIASNIMLPTAYKQAILSEVDGKDRLKRLVQLLYRETEVLVVEKGIQAEVQESIEKNHREFFLREQLKAIYRELGEGENPAEETAKFTEAINKLALDEKSKELLLKEVAKLNRLAPSSPEASVARSYIEECLALPWGKFTADKLDLKRVQAQLDKDHYGLKKVKDRILEYLAVRKLTEDGGGQILCLVGPPGVGKTSVATSIARAIGRKFARISLGGIHDEAEIRGHRKTYIGSMPGRIINAFKMAGSANPLILLDEIDKVSSDYKGDPASALLEVLDSEQNKTFRDNYIELPFDISRAMFITTANVTDTIPRPLLDRMEMIYIGSYTGEEKFEIAKRHLIAKQLKKNGVTRRDLTVSDDAIKLLIESYAKESGVRNLERYIAKICRKAAVAKVNGSGKCKVCAENLAEFVGPAHHTEDKGNEPKVGVATGLAWTEVGGETLKIEVSAMEGTGKIQLTGSLGDVMKESANAAITYIRSHAAELGVDPDFYKNTDIHVHVPEGAVPKDGPSAGITLATAILSELTKVPVSGEYAMTGEITLRGNVLAIGGLNEKLSAAVRLKVKNVIIPLENKADLEEVDKNVTEKLNIIPVSSVAEVFQTVLIYPESVQETLADAAQELITASELRAHTSICQ